MTDAHPHPRESTVVGDSSEPRAEYDRRLEARRARAREARRLEDRISNARLLTFVAGVAIGWFLWRIAPPLALAPVIVFAVLVAAHERARRSRLRAERARAFYERGLARLDYRFAGTGNAGLQFLDEAHPYAVHLDLFGEGSLYEFLCTSQTAAGREELASWLLDSPSSDLFADQSASVGERNASVHERNAAVRELHARLDLREELATIDPEVVTALESRHLIAWAEAPAVLEAPRLRAATRLLTAAALPALASLFWIGGIPLLAVIALEIVVSRLVAGRVRRVLGEVQRPARDLRRIRAIVGRLEAESFQTPVLTALHAALGAGGQPASPQLDRLLARLDRHEWRGNMLFAPIAPLLLWSTNSAFSIEDWRLQCGPHIGRWISAVGELEAFLDLATYAYEHPNDPFAELSEEAPLLDARQLGHPLLPEGARVRNDVRLDAEHRLLVVTGSNMSGKSTLLRTVGVNVVLARAGAPVCAASLRLSPLALAASIRTVDSLQEGASRFYAEVQALRRAVETAEREPPALFLLDELLHGTNSHDRRIGADGILRALLDRGAIGIATTHDLALAEIADDLAPEAANMHFEFRVVDGRLEFDYKLRPGVVRTGNALELMRTVGLDV